MRKIALGHEAWRQAENAPMEPAIWELVEQFQECPDISMDSDVFAELCERICESNTIYPAFYLVFPYLVDIVMGLEAGQARQLWEWMGAWISESYQPYASKLPREVMETYRESLATAERAVLDFISRYDFSSCGNSIHYLLGAPFAFVRPEFGYLSAMFDTELIEETACPAGHMETYTIRRKGMKDSSGRSVSPQEDSWEGIRGQLDRMPVRNANPWARLLPLIGTFEDCEAKSVAEAVCKKGLGTEAPFQAAVFLYLYLLQNISRDKGDTQFSKLCFQMFQKVSCPVCGASFAFIDGWQHPKQ